MKNIIALVLVLVLAGCTTNGVYDSGKTWTLIGAVVVGAVVVSSQSDSTPHEHELDCFYVISGSGSSQVCR